MEERLKRLPDRPGVYLMLSGAGEIIYVGKAISLKSRVRSYFRGKQVSPKVKALVSNIQDLEYIVTDSEVEALILECNLIKEHRPKYNVFLKDDKTYPYIKITLNEEFPRILVTRRIKKDGARYYGPYTSAGSMHATVKLLRQLFPVRSCKKLDKQERPCLNYHINRCLAPCADLITFEEYQKMIAEIILFLDGKQERVLDSLKERMSAAAAKLEFERAAQLRDQIAAVEKVLEKQKIVNLTEDDQDVVAFAVGKDEVCVQVFFVRSGKVMGREHFFLEGTDDLSRTEVMTHFIKQYYSRVVDIPRSILLQEPILDRDIIEQWLKEKRPGRVIIRVPVKGEKHKLIEMVARNAQLLLEEEQLLRKKNKMVEEAAVLELKQQLNLSALPKRIECFDVSNIQGSHTVASMVVYLNGKPKTDHYRRYKIETVKGPDDYAAIREVVYRRYKRGSGMQNLPDLIIIDGGKGQLSAATEVLDILRLREIPAFGLAEKEELLFQKGISEPIKLTEGSQALYLIQRIRDEAHRFAISYHRKLRSKESFKSVLDEIPGIGPKRKRALLNKFGTVAKIKTATLGELEDVPGMNKKVAQNVYEYLCK